VEVDLHLDGSTHRLTPEASVEIQAARGSDVAMVLDECPALPATFETVARGSRAYDARVTTLP
jgi:queuine tRNA-ribosyltransferase